MKSNYLLLYFLLFTAFGFAQNYDVGGIVKEAGSGLPIPGVNVQYKNATTGTATDLDGRFALNGVPSGTTLVFSYVGFKSFEFKVNSSNPALSVALQEDTNGLDEVVVIGYGTQKKRDVTGAVALIDSKRIDALKPVKVEQALQGAAAGVNVTAMSGSPGADYNIRIRGVATNKNNGPTILIDGYAGEIGLINPNDIESISILKDAQAAIYGASGANGIILITTKTGKRNTKTTVSYNTSTGFQETTRKLPLLNATEYALLLNESYANGGRPIPYPNASGLGKGTDWQDKVFQKNVPIISHDLTLSGGTDKITYAISGSHVDQEGIIGEGKSSYLRNTARVALGVDISSRIKLKTNIIYTSFNRRTLNENGLGSVLFNAVNVPSVFAPYDANGDFTLVPSTTGIGNEIINPLAQIANTYNSYKYRKLSGNATLDYQVIDPLKITASIGFNTSDSKSKDFAKQISYGGKVFDVPRSSVTQGRVNDNNYTFDLYATYKATLAGSHNITGVLGATVIKQWGDGLYATGYDVPNNSWQFADIHLTTGISNVKSNSSYGYDERQPSTFVRLQYDYKGRYFLSAMERRDTSTKFGPGNKVAYFPSFTGGWIISEESFFSKSSVIGFAKLRGSYGSLGNDKIDDNKYISLLNGEGSYVFDGTIVNGVAEGTIANPYVRWEDEKKFDIGLDLKLFNDKLGFTTDYFRDSRKALLIAGIPVSGIIGAGGPGSGYPTVNAGEVVNSGIEATFDYQKDFSPNFKMSLNYNVTVIDNKVKEVYKDTFIEGGSFGVGQPAPSRMEKGHAMGYFYGYETDGIFQNQAEVDAAPSQLALGAEASPGDIRYVDLNKDGVIDVKDKRDLGNPIPKAIMGFNLQLTYHSFDFGVFTMASLGNEIVRNYERTLSDANRMNYTLDRWTGEGTSNSVPRVTTAATSNNVFSDYFVEDGSYVRIQNAQIGFTVPGKYAEKAGISKLRLYASVNNLYTFTKYRGYDPGASNGNPIGDGIDNGFYPIPRTYMLGLNLNF